MQKTKVEMQESKMEIQTYNVNNTPYVDDQSLLIVPSQLSKRNHEVVSDYSIDKVK